MFWRLGYKCCFKYFIGTWILQFIYEIIVYTCQTSHGSTEYIGTETTSQTKSATLEES